MFLLLLSVSVLIWSSKLLMVFSMSSFVLFTLSGSPLIIKSAWFPMYSVSMSTWCFVFVFMILSPPFPMTTAAALLSFTSILSIAGLCCVSCFILFCSSFFVLSRVISTFSFFTSVTLSLLVLLIVSIMISAVILLASSVRCIPSFSIRCLDSSIFVSRAILLGNVISRYVLNLVVSLSWSRLLIVYLGGIWATMYLVSSRSSFSVIPMYSLMDSVANFSCLMSLVPAISTVVAFLCVASLSVSIISNASFMCIASMYWHSIPLVRFSWFCVRLAFESPISLICVVVSILFLVVFSSILFSRAVHLVRSSFFSLANNVLELFRILFVSSSFFTVFSRSAILSCCSSFFCVSSCNCSCRLCICFLFSFLCSLAIWLFSLSLLFSPVIFSFSLFSWAFSCFSSLFCCFCFRRASFVWVICLVFCVFPLFFSFVFLLFFSFWLSSLSGSCPLIMLMYSPGFLLVLELLRWLFSSLSLSSVSSFPAVSSVSCGSDRL